MHHDVSLIATVAAGLGLALVLGFVAARLRMPPLVGYLLAGVLIGPATPGYVADLGLARQLAEIGVMLLMFGVGLHFSLQDLRTVRRIAVPGALGQMLVTALLGMAAASLWGWGRGASLVFGLSLSVASTVVMLRALEARGLLRSMNGRIAVGWLVVQDLVTVLVLVLLPAVAGLLREPGGLPGALAGGDAGVAVVVTVAKVALFVALMLLVGRRMLPRVLWWVARTGSRELFTLGVVAIAVGVAFGAARLFDVSFALGAFFAGMMMRESEFAHRAADESLPLRDAFAVLFFVSVGMLLDPSVIWKEPARLLAVLAIVVGGNALSAIALVLLLRYPLSTALTVGASLAQVGEFSFVLASLGVALHLLPPGAQSLVVAAAVLTIAANPLVFSAVEPFRRWILLRSALARRLEHRDDPLARLPRSTDPALLSGQVVLVGYGRVGRRIAEALREARVPFVVAEQDRALVDALRREGLPAVSGDAADPAVLVQAHVRRASMLVVAIPDAVKVRRMVEIARRLNPTLPVVLRTHNDEEARLLAADGMGTVFLGEAELARGMARHVLDRVGRAR